MWLGEKRWGCFLEAENAHKYGNLNLTACAIAYSCLLSLMEYSNFFLSTAFIALSARGLLERFNLVAAICTALLKESFSGWAWRRLRCFRLFNSFTTEVTVESK